MRRLQNISVAEYLTHSWLVGLASEMHKLVDYMIIQQVKSVHPAVINVNTNVPRLSVNEIGNEDCLFQNNLKGMVQPEKKSVM